MNLILLGAPGSGKGTLARQIVSDYNIPQISTGDILRDNIKRGTKTGLLAKSYMDRGELVPDEVVIKLLKDRIKKADCKSGYILDGFPRTVSQAVALEKIAEIDGIILLDLPFDIIEERLITRRVCSSCGEIYNTRRYDKNVCQKCGAPLYQRDDDKLEAVKNRLEVYDKQTAPLINFYGVRVHKVNGDGSPEKVYGRVKTFLKKLEAKK